MRSLFLFVAAAGVTVAAIPASAQEYPSSRGYDYGYSYNGYGQFRELQSRINAVESQISYLNRRDIVGDGNADHLRRDAERLERKLRWSARDGLSPYEANEVRARIAELEQRVHYAIANRDDRYRGGDRDDRWGQDRD